MVLGPRCETISFFSFLFHLFSVLASEVPLLKIRISMLKLEPVLVDFYLGSEVVCPLVIAFARALL